MLTQSLAIINKVLSWNAILFAQGHLISIIEIDWQEMNARYLSYNYVYSM